MKLKIVEEFSLNHGVVHDTAITNIHGIYCNVYQENVSEKYYNHTGIILDDDDNEVTRFYHAYESVVLHTIQADALETIRADYDIPSDVFRLWCEQWMKDNKE